jgi:hypothetical protein
MRIFVLPIITLFFFSFLSSCRSNVDRFLFLTAGEEKLTMHEEPGRRTEEEGIIDPSRGLTASSLYRLSRPVQAKEDGSFFYIRYYSDLTGCILRLYDGEEKLLNTAALPNYPEKASVTFMLPLPREAVAAFSVESSGTDGRFQILQAGTSTNDQPEFVYRRDTVILRKGMEFSNDNEGNQYHFRFSSLKPDCSGILLSLDLSEYFPENRIWREDMKEEDIPSLMLTLQGEDAAARLSYRLPRENKADLYLYRSVLGFLPSELSVTFTAVDSPADVAENPAADGEENGSDAILSFSCLLQDELPAGFSAIPADLTSILSYAEEDWRREDFEVFSWNLYPQILIIDTADYSVQSKMFKRLAFFVEKKGFTGELHPNRVIEDLHGWNAHDYRAEDVAEFFNLGLKEDFPFNEEEVILKNILLENRILRQEDEMLAPLEGGVLSISRQSYEKQRLLLLRHEAFHGVYFGTPAFQRGVKNVWDALSAEEQWFWRLFLGWMAYETDHSDLVLNEFMAYHLQQSPAESDYYLGTVVAGRLKNSLPALSGRIEAFIGSFPATFTANSSRLSKILFKYSGLLAGRPDSLQIIKE